MSRVFISWSGTQSKSVAEALRDWLPTVIQSAQPWVSSWDIGAGRDWLGLIRGELEEAKCGILCLTRENLSAPWLLFEAGALAKHLGSPVCVFLLDMNPSDLSGPLSIFQSSTANREGVQGILDTINDTLDSPLEGNQLTVAMKRGWPELEEKLTLIRRIEPAELEPLRPDRELLEEILNRVRAMSAAQAHVREVSSEDALRLSVADDVTGSRVREAVRLAIAAMETARGGKPPTNPPTANPTDG